MVSNRSSKFRGNPKDEAEDVECRRKVEAAYGADENIVRKVVRMRQELVLEVACRITREGLSVAASSEHVGMGGNDNGAREAERTRDRAYQRTMGPAQMREKMAVSLVCLLA